MLSDVWNARLLLLLSAALYGTNFTLVKSIDDIPGMSVGLASTFRFGFAALVMLPLLFTPLEDEEHTSIMTLAVEQPTTTTTRRSIIVAGMEIGLYNSIGYLFQAEGLKTTTASKVRDYYM
jgi:drug/metabolite transporter (DMT)-like permease